jgi:hypothetical protein
VTDSSSCLLSVGELLCSDSLKAKAILDKHVNGGNPASRAATTKDIERIRRYPKIGMALGTNILISSLTGSTAGTRRKTASGPT